MEKLSRKYIMVKATEEEKEDFRTAAHNDGFKWLDSWMRWLAFNRAKKLKREEIDNK